MAWKKILCIVLLAVIFSCPCAAQSIFIDYVRLTDNDQAIYWVLTDPNGVKYRGVSNIALGADPNRHCQENMAGWLADIREMNTDPNIRDWGDVHDGKYKQGIDIINQIDTWEEFRAWERRKFKTSYPRMGIED